MLGFVGELVDDAHRAGLRLVVAGVAAGRLHQQRCDQVGGVERFAQQPVPHARLAA